MVILLVIRLLGKGVYISILFSGASGCKFYLFHNVARKVKQTNFLIQNNGYSINPQNNKMKIS